MRSSVEGVVVVAVGVGVVCVLVASAAAALRRRNSLAWLRKSRASRVVSAVDVGWILLVVGMVSMFACVSCFCFATTFFGVSRKECRLPLVLCLIATLWALETGGGVVITLRVLQSLDPGSREAGAPFHPPLVRHTSVGRFEEQRYGWLRHFKL